MIPFFVHDIAGRILRTGSASTEAAAMLQAIEPGETARIGAALPTDWWSGASVSPRPALPAAPATATVDTALVVEALPVGTSWRVLDEDGIEKGNGAVGEDNTLTLVFGMPGAFSLFLGENDSAFPYLPRLSTITVTDP